MVLISTGSDLLKKRMLRKKYEFDREFNVLTQLIGEMDDSIYIIDELLSDEYLFKLITLFVQGRIRILSLGWFGNYRS